MSSECLVIQNSYRMKKAELLNPFFVSDFSSKRGLKESQGLLTRERVWSKEDTLLVEQDQTREHIRN